MNKATWILGIIVIVVAIIAAFVLVRHGSTTPAASTTQETPSGTGNAAVGANGVSAIVTYSDTGFSPSPLTVSLGTTVTWVNQSSLALWVETTGPQGGDCADPTAQGALDECQAVQNGGTYSYTFTAPGTVTYFNHEKSGDTGTVVVTSATAAGPINPNAQPE